MPDWIRNLTMLAVLAVWSVAIGVYLWRGQLPDAALLGLPGAVYLLLNPPALGRRGGGAGQEQATTSPAPPAAEGQP